METIDLDKHISHIILMDEAIATAAYKHIEKEILWHETLLDAETDQPRKIHRKMAYCSDEPEMYYYAKLKFQGQTWIPYLKKLADQLEDRIMKPFNSVLLNMYKDGKDTIGWHSDKEPTLGDHPVIACVNLGATRKFWFREKETDAPPFFHLVKHGDLLVMGPECQKKYLHAILKEPEVKEPRISLTFRYNFSK